MDLKMVKVKIPSSKGELSATIHFPKNETEKLVILCPGYLDSKDYKHLIGLAEALSKEGYTVVRFDPTGTWESEGNISNYTNTQYLEDIKTVLEYMLHQKKYQYIVLGGHSRGGQVSILYAARDQRISLVLAIMPSSGRTMTGKRYEEWKKIGTSISYRDVPGNSSRKRKFEVPFSHVEDREKYNVVEEVKKIKVPLIFIAGEVDEVCLPEWVKEIFENAHQPKKFVLIKGIGHDYRHSDEEVIIVNEEVLKGIKGFSRHNI